MTRRAEQVPLEDDWVLTKVWSKRQSAPAILAAVQAVPRDEAFIPTPFGAKGEPFDPPENASQAVSGEYIPTAVYRVSYQGQGRIELEAIPGSEWKGPPNCDGNAQFGISDCELRAPGEAERSAAVARMVSALPTHAGEALAHAQHEAAIGGDECTAGACLLTRGSD